MEAFAIFVATESCKNSSYFMQHEKIILLGKTKLYIPSTLNIDLTDCVCSKMLDNGLNHQLFLSLFKFLDENTF